jgi:hypothetical protein
MVERLIAAVLNVETLLFHDTERDARHGRHNRGTGKRLCNL